MLSSLKVSLYAFCTSGSIFRLNRILYHTFISCVAILKCSDYSLTTNKRGRGRPIGGKHPPYMREYWRLAQQKHRVSNVFVEVKNVNRAVKQMGAKR